MNKKTISPELVKELATDIMLSVTDAEAAEIFKTEQSLRQKFQKVTKINTDGIEPMYYPFEINEVGLREDEVTFCNEQSDVLKNAPSVDQDFITIVKVVK